MKYRLIATGADLICTMNAAEEQVTAGGLLVPDVVAENTPMLTVISVGPGHVSDTREDGRVPLEFEPGDVVVARATTRFVVDGREFFLVSVSAVLCKLAPVASRLVSLS